MWNASYYLIVAIPGLVPKPADKMEEASRGGDGHGQEEAGRLAGGRPGRAEQRGGGGRGGARSLLRQESQARAGHAGSEPRPGLVSWRWRQRDNELDVCCGCDV